MIEDELRNLKRKGRVAIRCRSIFRKKSLFIRYFDAFCGSPKSALARHHTDYKPERIERIYKKLI
jgi:hypothetical protein